MMELNFKIFLRNKNRLHGNANSFIDKKKYKKYKEKKKKQELYNYDFLNK